MKERALRRKISRKERSYLYCPTGHFMLQQGTRRSRYETYNEAYYDLVEAQEKCPGEEMHIFAEIGFFRTKVADVRWTYADGVPTTSPLPLGQYVASAGWIYAACEYDAFPVVKIGTTYALPQRMRGLSSDVGGPILLRAAVYAHLDADKVEQRIHRLLASSRIEGEWFYLHMTQRILEALVEKAIKSCL